jgi:hypothetical protein
MARKIESNSVIPRGNVGPVDVESPLERNIRVWTKVGATIVGFLILICGFGLCAYMIINDKPQSALAFNVISGMIGAAIGLFYGTRASH